jgi:hypothetical protein
MGSQEADSQDDYIYSVDGRWAWTKDRRYAYQRLADGTWGEAIPVAAPSPAHAWPPRPADDGTSGSASRARIAGISSSEISRPRSPYETATTFQRRWAILGIVVGFASGLLWGVLAYYSWKGWKEGRKKRPLFAWTWAVIAGIPLTYFLGIFLVAMVGIMFDAVSGG